MYTRVGYVLYVALTKFSSNLHSTPRPNNNNALNNMALFTIINRKPIFTSFESDVPYIIKEWTNYVVNTVINLPSPRTKSGYTL